MKLSSPRFKSIAVTAGLTFWFFIITSTTGYFSYEVLLIFSISILAITQIFSYKISKGLDKFAIFNTIVFLGLLFIFMISIYGILFKLLRIDLLRLKKNKETYWLDIEETNSQRIVKQY
ncbi:hypothetical protein OAJ83_01070 [Candidatus Nitrosopelagicus sp.]|jgi:hypothetical protein|nr:hypothetical protein [Candidatus Nitrosopelagicus sp.]|tara:strand:+ start:289 stop:645 length:357 start_codon:yes stop_codon:yes gene_type:complete